MIVEFDPTSYIFSESGVFVSITIVKRGETTQTVSVDVSTSDGTATGECLFDCNHCPIFIFARPLCIAGQDYVARSQRITFQPMVTLQTVPVSILDDNSVESVVEQFTVLLSVPAGQRRVGLGADTATVEITDNDGKFLL